MAKLRYALGFLIIIFPYFSCTYAAVKISVAGPMSGPFAVFGDQMKIGAGLAVRHLNQAGGVLGQTIQLEISDDQCREARAVGVANQMVGRGVKAMIGHVCAAATIPASQIYARERIVQITPATTNPKYTDERPLQDGGNYRLVGRDDEEGAVAGSYLLAHHFADIIGIIHDGGNYAQAIATGVKEALNNSNKSPRLLEVFDPGQRSYKGLVKKLAARGVDVLVVVGYFADVATIVTEVKTQLPDLTILSGESIAVSEFGSSAGAAAEGVLTVLPPMLNERPEATLLVDELSGQKIYPENLIISTYAAVELWAKAAELAGSFEFSEVVHILNTETLSTVIGPISFDAKGDMEQPGFVVYEWRDGTYWPPAN